MNSQARKDKNQSGKERSWSNNPIKIIIQVDKRAFYLESPTIRGRMSKNENAIDKNNHRFFS
jgi:hypothetical protein